MGDGVNKGLYPMTCFGFRSIETFGFYEYKTIY
jgi:hypothetical protein